MDDGTKDYRIMWAESGETDGTVCATEDERDMFAERWAAEFIAENRVNPTDWCVLVCEGEYRDGLWIEGPWRTVYSHENPNGI